jgi:hypothetical protein
LAEVKCIRGSFSIKNVKIKSLTHYLTNVLLKLTQPNEGLKQSIIKGETSSDKTKKKAVRAADA